MTTDETIDVLCAKCLCHRCVGEDYLRTEIKAKGKRRKCSYCGITTNSYEVGDVAKCFEIAFDQHYVRILDQPNPYWWDHDGKPVILAIMDAADIPQDAAEDIQLILKETYADSEAAEMGYETEFADDTYYEKIRANDHIWQENWRAFEDDLKTKARFFSRTASAYLACVFHGIERLSTSDGRPLVVEAGPGTAYPAFFRARVFQSGKLLEEALCRPDIELGPPPAHLANAGRMNASGIAVFYGANDPAVAIAEVRPPVGSKVMVARFDILRPLRLLDLAALNLVSIRGSIFDPKFADDLEHIEFLRTLCQRITRPVMPNDEVLDYLPTQAVADFLATEAKQPLDGILFPSVQAAGNAVNCVLFHKATRVEALDIPAGTEISVSTGENSEDGWEVEFSVIEQVPLQPESENEISSVSFLYRDMEHSRRHAGFDDCQLTLRLVTDTVAVHIVQSVQVKTVDFPVARRRLVK